MPALKYQPSVDGLRAVAVLAVLGFHAKVAWLGGGFVGVDIFFVISGYLITSILRDDLAAGRFSLLRFYERRIRRIFPPLFFLLAVMFLAGATVMLPSEFAALGKNAIATALFVSNITFWKASGYFHRDSESNPLLHTWSLSVEEQFYLVVPIVLYVAFRYFHRGLIPLLWIMAGISLALSIRLTETAQSFAFFMAPTRVWEFLAGSLLAWNAIPAVRHRHGREVVALAGAGLITWSIASYTSNSLFPGLGAIPPVLGAVLVIHAGGQTLVARVLSLRPIVFVGLISYSLYLWHWPVLVYLRYLGGHDGSVPPVPTVFLVSLGLAILSWRLVEQPFRSGRAWTRRQVFAGGSAVLAASVAAGLLVHVERGWPQRFPEAVTVAERAAADFSPMRTRCHASDENAVPVEQSCVYGSPVAPASAIWGDSHVVELAYALGELAGQHGRSILHLSYSACPPAVDFDGRFSRGCHAYNDQALQRLLSSPGIKTVFLAARYNAEVYVGTNLAGSMREAVADLVRAGKEVVLVSPIPTANMDVPRLLAHKMLTDGTAQQVSISRATFDRDSQHAFSYLAQLQQEYGIPAVRPDQALCDQTSCGVARDGKSLYFDDIHPSLTGARYIANLFVPYLIR
ncbi:MAG TPA: acyltransferase family protein [Geminicoccus sp.]|jgi:peptidoglycan/LPS O-acetylase OafA/YrhL|uniref:acyltransferase family protein n=1 Tax=Geminicoccus sp. TaxID=2024832 RepID=UPI002E37CD2C|nr:acyltransferase family protein [Geminicoccus sp.]HEX2526537.1 acyltransferase family protein [Geminicoccus sp.]